MPTELKPREHAFAKLTLAHMKADGCNIGDMLTEQERLAERFATARAASRCAICDGPVQDGDAVCPSCLAG